VYFHNCCCSYVLLTQTLTISSTGVNYNSKLSGHLYNSDWMKSIPDNTPVSAITIPGTHKSLSLSGLPNFVCQVWTLDKQLHVGLRFFDIHTAIWFPHQLPYIQDSNWILWKRITFQDVLKTIFKFLETHKDETVLMKITIHGIVQDKIVNMLEKQISKHKDQIWTELSVPNMAQARGKIVLLQSPTFHHGAENQKSFFFRNNKLINVEDRIQKLRSHLCDHHFVLTDNAVAWYHSPKTLAEKVNKQIYDLVKEHKKSSLNQGCLGIFSMNFPSADLIKHITEIKPCSCGGEPEPTEPEPE
uniref:Phosphatidylinositol-specific phospholipase C X domain-containing protein n=1 Tax=Lates calcarifer TaxID=8187 RepID=A0A4W6C4F3_LATCA